MLNKNIVPNHILTVNYSSCNEEYQHTLSLKKTKQNSKFGEFADTVNTPPYVL